MQIMPTSAWGIRLGYMSFDDNIASAGPYVNKTHTTTSYGVNYNYADNVRFSLEYSTEDPDNGSSNTQTQLTTLVGF